MAMEFGGIRNKFIKAAIEWIRNKVWGSINGLVSKFTKDSSEMILEKGMGSSILLVRQRSRHWFTKDVGDRVKNGKKVSLMRKR